MLKLPLSIYQDYFPNIEFYGLSIPGCMATAYLPIISVYCFRFHAKLITSHARRGISPAAYYATSMMASIGFDCSLTPYLSLPIGYWSLYYFEGASTLAPYYISLLLACFESAEESIGHFARWIACRRYFTTPDFHDTVTHCLRSFSMPSLAFTRFSRPPLCIGYMPSDCLLSCRFHYTAIRLIIFFISAFHIYIYYIM